MKKQLKPLIVFVLTAIILFAASCTAASGAIVLNNSFSPNERSEYSVTRRVFLSGSDTSGAVAAEGNLSYSYSKTPEGMPVLDQSMTVIHNGTVAYNDGKIDTMQSRVVFSDNTSRYFFPILYSKTMMISSKNSETDNAVNSYSITADFSNTLSGKYTLFNKDGTVYTSDSVNAQNDISFSEKNIKSANGINAYDNEQLFTIIRCMDKKTHFIPGKALSFKISSLPDTVFRDELTYFSVSATITEELTYFDAPDSLKGLAIVDADNKIPCYRVVISVSTGSGGTGPAIDAWFSTADTGAMNRILVAVKQYTSSVNADSASSETVFMLKNYIQDASV